MLSCFHWTPRNFEKRQSTTLLLHVITMLRLLLMSQNFCRRKIGWKIQRQRSESYSRQLTSSSRHLPSWNVGEKITVWRVWGTVRTNKWEIPYQML